MKYFVVLAIAILLYSPSMHAMEAGHTMVAEEKLAALPGRRASQDPSASTAPVAITDSRSLAAKKSTAPSNTNDSTFRSATRSAHSNAPEEDMAKLMSDTQEPKKVATLPRLLIAGGAALGAFYLIRSWSTKK